MSEQAPLPAPPPHRRVGLTWLLLLIALVGAAARWRQLDESLWLDELHTAWCVTGTWDEVAVRSRLGNQSPCYFWGLRLLVDVLGCSERTLRLPSFVCGVGLIVAVGLTTANGSRSRGAGCLAALLVALDPHCVFFSQEARPYAAIQFFGWLQWLAFLQRLRDDNGQARFMFVVGAIGLFHLHYTAGLLIATQAAAVIVLGCWRGPTRRHADQPGAAHGAGLSRSLWAADFSIIVAGCLPSVWHLLAIADRREIWSRFVSAPDLDDFATVLGLTRYLAVPIALWMLDRWWHPQRFSEEPLLPVSRAEHHPTPSTSLAILLLGPASLAAVATHAQVVSLFLRRYFVASVAAAPALAALIVGNFRSCWLRTLGITATVGVALALGSGPQWWRDGRFHTDRQQDWRGAIAFVQSSFVSPRETCWVRSGLVESDQLRDNASGELEEYCLLPVRALYPLDASVHALPNTDPATFFYEREVVARRLSARTWFIINGGEATRARFPREVLARCSSAGYSVEWQTTRTFGDCWVGLLVVTAAADTPRS